MVILINIIVSLEQPKVGLQSAPKIQKTSVLHRKYGGAVEDPFGHALFLSCKIHPRVLILLTKHYDFLDGEQHAVGLVHFSLQIPVECTCTVICSSTSVKPQFSLGNTEEQSRSVCTSASLFSSKIHPRVIILLTKQ